MPAKRVSTTILLAVGLAAPIGALATASPAAAATGAPFDPSQSIARPTVTEVHWEWRHHHRYWVRDRRRYDHRDDHRDDRR
jgi:hypothetical protein